MVQNVSPAGLQRCGKWFAVSTVRRDVPVLAAFRNELEIGEERRDRGLKHEGLVRVPEPVNGRADSQQ